MGTRNERPQLDPETLPSDLRRKNQDDTLSRDALQPLMRESPGFTVSGFRKLDYYLYIFTGALKGSTKIRRILSPCQKPRKPVTVRSGQSLGCLIPMSLVGIHTTYNDIVAKYYPSRHIGR